MSLFQGLFPTTSGPTSSLFSKDSKYKRLEQEQNSVITRIVAPSAISEKKKRKSVQEGAQLENVGNGASEQPVKKKAKHTSKKVGQAPDKTETPLQPAPAVAEPLQSGSSLHPAPLKADRGKPKKGRKPGPDSVFPAPGKSGSPSKAAKSPKERSSAEAHAETRADMSEQGWTHEAAVGKREEDASALDTDVPEVAGGREGAKGAEEAGPAKRRRTEEEKVERLRRTIFVGNLPVKVKAKLIKQAFSQYGTVESVRLRSLPLKDDGKLPRRAAVAAGAVDEAGSANAYVVFSSGTSAVHALAHNMREFEGRHIRVDRAAAVSKGIEGGGTQVLYDSARSVFVGNLPFDTKDEELIELFGDGKGGPGSVTAVRVVRDAKTSVGKGIAFVEFSGRPAARMAMSADGRVLRGRPIRVTRVAKSGAAAAAAADASAAGGSRLRTPFSRGVKAGQSVGAGPRKAAKPGQEKGTPRPGSQAAWQGMRTKGQKKIVGGFAAKEREGPGVAAAGGAPQGAPRKPADGKPKGKRPSVAARKQQLLSKKKQKTS